MSFVGRGSLHEWRPPILPDGSFLLFNGHIDNRAELLSELSLPPATGDGQLYAAVFARWGSQAENRVIGQYCAATISQDCKEALLVRSPVRAPPLHIWCGANDLVVASVPRAIFATGLISPKVDDQKIADSLYLNYEEEERSWYRDISRLPIGSRATINSRSCEISRYYDVASLAPVRFERDEDYVDQARELLALATKSALEPFSNPAISLSGGFDSQAVAALALRNLVPGEVLRGYTGVPETGWQPEDIPGRFGDEWPLVKLLSDQYPQLQIARVDAAGLSFDHKLAQIFLLAGISPFAAMNLHWMHEIWRSARAEGCDVMLTGDFGNGTFSASGEWAYSGMTSRREWAKLGRELRAISRNPVDFARNVASKVLWPRLPNLLANAVSGLRGKPTPFESWCSLNPEWARAMNVEERSHEMGRDKHFRQIRGPLHFRRNFGGGESGDIDQVFCELHGIEHRDPTSYRPLAEFCFAIPDDQFIRKGQSRWLARRVLKDLVPEAVRTERGRGRQAADWSLRLARDRPALLAELDRLARDPAMAARFDLIGLRKDLAEWNGSSPSEARLASRLEHAIPRALTTARFIRFVEQRNDYE